MWNFSYEDEDRSDFIRWVDGEWDKRIKKTITNLWDIVERWRKREAIIEEEMYKVLALRNRMEVPKAAELKKDAMLKLKDDLLQKGLLLREREIQIKKMAGHYI